MSRAFSPPDTLSKEDRYTLGDVRREIWRQALVGMSVGSITGLSAHYITSKVQPHVKSLHGMSLNRNTAMASFFLGAALGSFLMATTTGKNQVHRLYPIFEIGKLAEGETRPHPIEYYQRSIQRAKERGEQLNSEMIDNPKERMWNRALRRKTLQRRMTEETKEVFMKDDDNDELMFDDDESIMMRDDEDFNKFSK